LATKMNCKIVTFADVYAMVKKISREVEASGYDPTTIIGLARGGWVPARLMCDFLGITDLISLKTEHWLQTGKTKDEATVRYPLTTNLNGKRVLIIDDITDTGKSLIIAQDYVHKHCCPETVKVATMQYLPQSQCHPDFFAEEVKVWTWFIYPWNWIEDTTTLIVRLLASHKGGEWNLNAIVEGLQESFTITWNKKMLKDILQIMVERGQVETFPMKQNVTYKLKTEKVIELSG